MGSAAVITSKYNDVRVSGPWPHSGSWAKSYPKGAEVMDDALTISSAEIVALSRAIDAATDRGDTDEAIRLSSMTWEEARRWLDAHGYPQRGDDDS